MQRFETAIRIAGYKEVGIRISAYQAERVVLICCPDILISWSPDVRPTEVQSLIEFKALK